MTTKEELLLDEMENTPDEFLKQVTYKPPELSAEIANSLTIGKSDARAEIGEPIVIDSEDIRTPNPTPVNDDRDLNPDNEPDTGSDVFNLGDLIDSGTAISLLELLLIFLGAIVCTKFLKVDIDKSEFQFTPEEKKTIAKPLAKCLKSSTAGTKNPWVALIIVLVAILAMKGLTIYMMVKAQKENQPPEISPEAVKRTSFKSAPTPNKRGRKPGGKNRVKVDPPPIQNQNIILT